MRGIFDRAKIKILHDFSDEKVAERIASIRFATLSPRQMVKTLTNDSYATHSSIPAYYDPNNHTIFLNTHSLSSVDPITGFIICYHELIHAASHHDNFHLRNSNVFQSGIKIETYCAKQYSCINRLLNEGIVQYMTTNNNDVNAAKYGYFREVSLVTRIVSDIGVSLVRHALMSGMYDSFVARFEEMYGFSTFSGFSKAVDQRRYHTAELILDQVKSTTFSFVPSSVSV